MLVEEDDEDDQEESRDGAQESQKGKSKDAAVADPAEKQKESPKNKNDPEVKSTAIIS